MSSQPNSQPAANRALNKAMREAVDFIHAEGWDAPPTLFALVPTDLVAAQLGDVDGIPLSHSWSRISPKVSSRVRIT